MNALMVLKLLNVVRSRVTRSASSYLQSYKKVNKANLYK